MDANDVAFRTSFPYVALAHSGTASVPHGVEAPAAAAQPPAAGSTGGQQAGGGTSMGAGSTPGMPKTGTARGMFEIDHLADVYGLALAAIAGVGGLMLVGGWAVRRKGTVTTKK